MNELIKILRDLNVYLQYVRENKQFTIYRDKSKWEEVTEIVETGGFKSAEGEIVVREVQEGLIFEKWKSSGSLEILESEINQCQKCSLGQTRNKFVFGSGNPNAEVVVVGEAPGADEDLQGMPFVGKAGKLLTDILKAINFQREEVYICNILKCRPPNNRNPLPEEIEKCEPYLIKQLELIKPKMILAAGAFAGQTLLKNKEPLGKLRGKFHNLKIGDIQIKVLVTFHPAALLRNPNWKYPTWEDVKLFRKEYDKIKNS
ncbi:MAG: uracil-DNA glycosylase [Ignavibacteria bacterium]